MAGEASIRGGGRSRRGGRSAQGPNAKWARGRARHEGKAAGAKSGQRMEKVTGKGGSAVREAAAPLLRTFNPGGDKDGKSESQQPATRNPKQKRKRSEGREAPEGCTAIGHPAKDGKANKGGGSSAVREAARQLLEAFAPLTGREEAEEPQPQKYKGAGGSELVVELQGLRKQKTNKKPEQGGDREAEELESHRKQKMQTSHGGGRGQEAEEPQAAWKPKNIGVGGVEKALGLPPSKKQKSMEGREQKEADQAEIKAMHGIAGKKGEKARERKNSKREHKPEAVDLVGGVRASGEGQRGAEHGEAGGGSKAHKRRKVHEHLHMKGEVLTPETLSERAFDTDVTDHCETPFQAYRDIEPMLFRIAQSAGKTKAELRVYDPYYCEGSMLKHMAKLGFTSVYNRNEDFYKTIKCGKVPEHDVIVTNPPFSGDHLAKIVSFCVSNPRGIKPFFLLMPNFVMRKTYYKESISCLPSPPVFLTPSTNYKFWSPGRSKFCSRFVANTRGGAGAATPFVTIWFIGGLQPRDGTGLIEWWRKKYAKSAECVLAAHDNELPEKAVPIRVPGGEKRPNPRRRRAMMAKSDGRNESRRQAYNFNT